MALLGSALGSEVGLRLLLSPAASNVIVRSACTVVGVGFPIYSTHKAIERKDPAEQELWLVYWAAYGCFSVAEMVTDKLVSWFPMYHHAKFVFLVWLQLPNNYKTWLWCLTYIIPDFGSNYLSRQLAQPFAFLAAKHSKGARHMYQSLLRPFLLKHHARFDRIVDGTRNDMNKFIISHQHEILAIRNTIQKVAVTVYRAAEEALRSVRIDGSRPDPSPRTGTSSPASEDDIPVSGFESVSGHPVEDPSWIEVPRSESLRDRSSRGGLSG